MALTSLSGNGTGRYISGSNVVEICDEISVSAITEFVFAIYQAL